MSCKRERCLVYGIQSSFEEIVLLYTFYTMKRLGVCLLFSLVSHSQLNDFAQRTMAVIRLPRTNRLFLSETANAVHFVLWMKYIISETNISQNIE